MTKLTSDDRLVQDIRGLIEAARSTVSVTVNAELIDLLQEIAFHDEGEDHTLLLTRMIEWKSGDKRSPDLVFRDPYFLDLLGLQDQFQEQDLEAAILREIEAFLLEMGSGFTFVARQKRIQIDSDDFYIDLLLYHRKLRRLVAIELKTGSFKAEYKGQMELYLRWLDRYDREPHEEAPLGIILCAGKKQEQIELLELDQSGIHVAEYLTALPSIEVLQQKLRSAMELAQARLENRRDG